MTQAESPFSRSIGFGGVIRWILVVAGMIAIGAAFSGGNTALGIAGIAFVLVALSLGYRSWRIRQQ